MTLRTVAIDWSVFQVGGAGSVGTGSLRGMPVLAQLRNAGFAVWPFDEPRWPRIIEIYPRLLTGAVNKGSLEARTDYLAIRHPMLATGVRRLAASSEDAFDAAVSALAMDAARGELDDLSAIDDPQVRFEGQRWIPLAGAPDMRWTALLHAAFPDTITSADEQQVKIYVRDVRPTSAGRMLSRCGLLAMVMAAACGSPRAAPRAREAALVADTRMTASSQRVGILTSDTLDFTLHAFIGWTSGGATSLPELGMIAADGRIAGYDPESTRFVSQIPRASYDSVPTLDDDDRPEGDTTAVVPGGIDLRELELPARRGETFTLVAMAHDSGTFALSIDLYSTHRAASVRRELRHFSLRAGEVRRIPLRVGDGILDVTALPGDSLR